MSPLDKDGVIVSYNEGFINLLLVENKEDCRLNFISKFRQMNFEVETFLTCSEAQKRLDDELSPKIDFLVIDADVVNGIDGISFARRHRENYPILLISTKIESLDEVKEEGFVTLHKPQEDHLLANKINRARYEFVSSKTLIETKDGLDSLKDIVFDIQDNLNGMTQNFERYCEKTNENFNEIKCLVSEVKQTQEKSFFKIFNMSNATDILSTLRSFFSTAKVFVFFVIFLVLMFYGHKIDLKAIVKFFQSIF